MLSVQKIIKSYGLQTLLNEISFNLNRGDRTGLVGPNGCGKTTLMRILAGDENADHGAVTETVPDLRIGYLAQGHDPASGDTIRDILGPAAVPTRELEAELADLAALLAAEPENIDIQERYDGVLQRVSLNTTPPEKILEPLGLAKYPPDTPVSQMSGGQKTRLYLARVLLQEPHLLLLDEPTNHLDIEMLEWLESWIVNFQGATLIVSHDRAFLDNVTTRILELDPLRGSLKEYAGNYSDYLCQKRIERQKLEQAYTDQQAEIRRMKQDITRVRAQAESTERKASSIRIGGPDYKIKGFKSYKQGIAKKVAKKARSREKKLERYIASDQHVERPREVWQMKLAFAVDAVQSKDIWTAENLSIGYPGSPPLLSSLNLYIGGGEHIALTGRNGSGKTTLLRTIAGTLPPQAGSCRLGPSIRPGYMAQEQEFLEPDLSSLESIQRISGVNQTEARRFLHLFLFSGDDPLRPVSELSYGERARLQLGLLVARGCNFLILDEPINHLDIASRTQFEQALAGFNGTVLAVVHDRYFIEKFATQRWTLVQGKIETTK
ncbi:MAG: ABC-F family ATP-binding cassette domain-containing protein [Anaerolineales bacterium]|nr:ABC-F family ATP-binding cassette domain-containing protein [Anaerolineales bacterium]